MISVFKKEATTYFENRGLYVLKFKDIKKCSDLLLISFKDYPLFNYFFEKVDYNIKKLYFDVTAKAMVLDTLIIADSENVNSILCFSEPHTKGITLVKYLKCGAGKFLLKIGIKAIIRMLKCLDIQDKIMNKYKSNTDYYLFMLATHPSEQRKGFASKLIKEFMNFADQNNCGIYLETYSKIDVMIYTKLGFQLKEIVDIKDSNNMKLYSFYYKK